MKRAVDELKWIEDLIALLFEYLHMNQVNQMFDVTLVHFIWIEQLNIIVSV